jgi:hypothetical protein
VVRKQGVTDTAGKHKEEKTMSLRSAFEYRMAQTIRPIRNYYIVIVAIMVLDGIWVYLKKSFIGDITAVESLNFHYISGTMAIVIMLGGLYLGNVLKMCLQNGISRKTLFYTLLLHAGMIGFGMTAIDMFLAWVIQRQEFGEGFWFMFYVNSYGGVAPANPSSLFVGYFWYSLLYTGCTILGSLLGVISLRWSWGRWAVLGGLLVLFAGVFYLQGTGDIDLYNKLYAAVMWSLGLGGIYTAQFDPNPYYAMISFSVGILLFSGLLYWAIRRVVARWE